MNPSPCTHAPAGRVQHGVRIAALLGARGSRRLLLGVAHPRRRRALLLARGPGPPWRQDELGPEVVAWPPRAAHLLHTPLRHHRLQQQLLTRSGRGRRGGGFLAVLLPEAPVQGLHGKRLQCFGLRAADQGLLDCEREGGVADVGANLVQDAHAVRFHGRLYTGKGWLVGGLVG